MNKSIYAVSDGWRYAPGQPEEFWRVVVRKAPQGYLGVFAEENIPKRTILLRDGGVVVTSVDDVPKDKSYAVLIGEGLFLAPRDYSKLESFWYLNHSCEANIARLGGLIYLTKRDIIKGEELTIDYAPLVAGVPNWSLHCQCGSKLCRKVISSDDWRNRELATKLWEEWLPHIQRRISKRPMGPSEE